MRGRDKESEMKVALLTINGEEEGDVIREQYVDKLSHIYQ